MYKPNSNGTYPNHGKVDTKAGVDSMLISGAFQRYRSDRIVFANKSHKTEEAYIYTEKALLKHIGKDIFLSELSFEMIREWVGAMKRRGLSSGTIRGYIVNTRAVLNYMTILGVECIKPELITIPDRIDPAPNFLTPKEINYLLQVIEKQKHCLRICKARNRAIVSLLYSTGLRASELLSLNRDDIAEDVFSVLGKGKKRRSCMIDERSRKLINFYLSMRKDGNPALFVEANTSTRLTTNGLRHMFAGLSRKAKLGKQIHAHTLRHSFANNLMRQGCHIYPLSRLMGHSNIATTQVYFQLYDPELVEIHKKYHTI